MHNHHLRAMMWWGAVVVVVGHMVVVGGGHMVVVVVIMGHMVVVVSVVSVVNGISTSSCRHRLVMLLMSFCLHSEHTTQILMTHVDRGYSVCAHNPSPEPSFAFSCSWKKGCKEVKEA